MIRFGVHTGLQDTGVAEIVRFWTGVEELGFDWISIWDHFYSAEPTLKSDCLEAVSMHAMLASVTSKVRCGSLVYCVSYRHPAVLANAIATIDHISGGRVELGIGCGWHSLEHSAYGIPFRPVGDRLHVVEEYVQCVRGLLSSEVFTFEGSEFRLLDARCDPKPLQTKVPIWIGGGGERVTLRQVARFADGMNVGFLSAQVLKSKLDVLYAHCQAVERDPKTIRTAVNLGLCWDPRDVATRYGHMPMETSGGILTGSESEVALQLDQYVRTGVNQINFAVRAPFALSDFTRLVPILADLRERSMTAGGDA